MKKTKTRIAFSLMINVLLLAISLLYKHLLYDKGYVGDCFFRNTLSIYCPACGGSRSLSSLLSFRFISSFILYPPLLISLGVILYYEIRWILLSLKNDQKSTFISKYLLLIIPISVILNFILRIILLYFFKIDLIETGLHLNI